MDKKNYSSPYFSLSFRQSNKKTAIDMQLLLPFVTTKDIPATISFLKEFFPGVLKTQCFNEKNLPFSIEARDTEIAHLFEHILLENLCILELKSGVKSSIFNGRTFWDWQNNQFGYFEIWVDIGHEKIQIFVEALQKTILLVENLIQTISAFQNLPLQKHLRASI